MAIALPSPFDFLRSVQIKNPIFREAEIGFFTNLKPLQLLALVKTYAFYVSSLAFQRCQCQPVQNYPGNWHQGCRLQELLGWENLTVCQAFSSEDIQV